MRKKLVEQARANGGEAHFLGLVEVTEDLPTPFRTNAVSSIVYNAGPADVDPAGAVAGVDVSYNTDMTLMPVIT